MLNLKLAIRTGVLSPLCGMETITIPMACTSLKVCSKPTVWDGDSWQAMVNFYLRFLFQAHCVGWRPWIGRIGVCYGKVPF